MEQMYVYINQLKVVDSEQTFSLSIDPEIFERCITELENMVRDSSFPQ